MAHINMSADMKASRVRVSGLVQGVGFRPFIHRIARKWELTGWVKNTNYGVDLMIQGTATGITGFLTDLRRDSPPLSSIERIEVEDALPDAAVTGFSIVKSGASSDEITRVSPDVCVCPDCLEDMRNQPNRIDYPFTNCTNCGPRFSIIRDLPYDRKKTTMESFIMCESCRREYEDIDDRRFHAQPNACSDCGPVCTFTGPEGETSEIHRILEETARLIDAGGIIAIKGIGGFHLVCSALDENAVQSLRDRKGREAKPFALMARDLETVGRYACHSPEERELLTSLRRPIVLLKRTGDIASPVACGLDTLGIMLPYTPFHFLLFRYLRTDLIVATSGNLSDEPIVIDNRTAFTRLKPVADAFVTYNRDIYNRCDDSVVMVAAGIPRIIRRSRGYVPEPILLDLETEGVCAFGGELKHTFCIGKGNQAIVSQHLGDLKTAETLDFFSEAFERFSRLFRFTPRLAACDMHPDYLSTDFCLDTGLPTVRVQHHHAHIAACMAENRVSGDVIGISMDGTGFGDDGAVWGGEFLLCGYTKYRRYAHLEYLPLPGGDTAVREPWRMTVSWLFKAFGENFLDLDIPFIRDLGGEPAGSLVEVLKSRKATVPTSSAGRLFDAVAALLGLVRIARFEAEGPMRLESILEPVDSVYEWEPGEGIGLVPMWRGMVRDIIDGVPAGRIAGTFHNTLSELIVDTAIRMRKDTGIGTTALSGGVFQNRYLLTRCEERLSRAGFTVLSHRLVPANDGGISLGQLAAASAGLCQGRL